MSCNHCNGNYITLDVTIPSVKQTLGRAAALVTATVVETHVTISAVSNWKAFAVWSQQLVTINTVVITVVSVTRLLQHTRRKLW